jgi:HPt (histidine-containing phosphotransfer) domain-containing protein
VHVTLTCKNPAINPRTLPIECDVREPVDTSSLQELRQMQRPGAPDAVAAIISHFFAESAERLAALRQAAENDDAPALERTSRR